MLHHDEVLTGGRDSILTGTSAAAQGTSSASGLECLDWYL